MLHTIKPRAAATSCRPSAWPSVRIVSNRRVRIATTHASNPSTPRTSHRHNPIRETTLPVPTNPTTRTPRTSTSDRQIRRLRTGHQRKHEHPARTKTDPRQSQHTGRQSALTAPNRVKPNPSTRPLLTIPVHVHLNVHVHARGAKTARPETPTQNKHPSSTGTTPTQVGVRSDTVGRLRELSGLFHLLLEPFFTSIRSVTLSGIAALRLDCHRAHRRRLLASIK
ncbi:MAG: hypothetical protein RL701_6922 [Pseudomonadota bacterium]